MDELKEYSLASYIDIFILGVQGVMKKINSLHNWLEENADTISAYINVFVDFGIWFLAVEKLKNNQIIFTDDLTFELSNQIYKSEDVETFIKNYYFDNDNKNYNALVERCSKISFVKSYDGFFSEIISACEREHYHLACAGLFSMLDGVLAVASNMIDVTEFKKRIDAILNKIASKIELSDLDKRLVCIFLSMQSFDKSIFSNSNFKGKEPDQLNRHWIIHGRSHRVYDKYDVVKELLWLEAIDIIIESGERLNHCEME